MSSVNKLYNGMGRCPYHPRMMLKVIIYAYMNNIYSCRRIEQLLLRDIHFIWLSGYEKPDFITINRFRNRLKDEINNIFTQLVLILATKGYVSLDVEYVDGTKIESKANKYTFVWRKTVERNRARLIDKVKSLLAQVDDCIAQENTKTDETVEFTPSQLAEISAELNASLSDPQVEMDKEEKKKRRKLAKELKERSEKLAEYDRHLETLGDRNSYSKTDKDATFMHMKEDAINDGLTNPDTICRLLPKTSSLPTLHCSPTLQTPLPTSHSWNRSVSVTDILRQRKWQTPVMVPRRITSLWSRTAPLPM